MRHKLMFLFILIVGLAGPWTGRAAQPDTLNYQGRMRTAAGAPVADGNYDAIFTLWTAPVGGSMLWSESWTGGTTQVGTQSGLFNVVLGTYNTLGALPFDNQYYLQVAWHNGASYEDLLPRQPLTSGPYAFRAKYAESATIAAPLSLTLTGTNATESAIYGLNLGPGPGIYGANNNIGPGVFGLSNNVNGAGIYAANSAGGIALNVLGKSGFTGTVPNGQNLVYVSQTQTAGGGTAFVAFNNASANAAVAGFSYDTTVPGPATQPGSGVQGAGPVGVIGVTTLINGIGVVGSVSGAAATAVFGINEGMGTAVQGQSAGGMGVDGRGLTGVAGTAEQAGGVGVYASNGGQPGAKALKVQGQADFTQAGTVDFTGASVIGLSGTGEVNTASNVGPGYGLFHQKSGVDLQFKSLTSSSGTVSYAGGTGTTLSLDVNNFAAIWNAQQLRGTGISAAAPLTGQALVYDGANWGPQSLSGFVLKSGDNMSGALSIASGIPQALSASASASAGSVVGIVGTAHNSNFAGFSSIGVLGQASGTGTVVTAGVQGEGNTGVLGIGTGEGVRGYTGSNGGVGVQGSASLGTGVSGEGRTGTTGVALGAGGVGVLARQNTGSLALLSEGNARFDGSGNTTTFNTYVSFTAGTNINTAVPNPLFLSNTAGVPVIEAYQNGAADAIRGTNNSGVGFGLAGMGMGTGGGVYAVANGAGGRAVVADGVTLGLSATAWGVDGRAIYAASPVSYTGTIYVFNSDTSVPSSSNAAGRGIDANGPIGVYGRSTLNNGVGVMGSVPSGGSGGAGVVGIHNGNGVGVSGEGQTGVNARSTQAGGTGLFVDQYLGAMALNVSGSAQFGPSGATFDFLPGTNVDFTGATVTGLPASGDIFEVYAGAGLLGGATSGAASLSVNAGTGANQIVQLNGSSQLPGVSGALLTNLPPPAAPLSLTNATAASTISTFNTFSGQALFVRGNGAAQKAMSVEGGAFGISVTANGAGAADAAVYASTDNTSISTGTIRAINTNSGNAVFGRTEGGTGIYGYQARVATASGYGVYGENLGAVASAVGVYGIANNGTGVRGSGIKGVVATGGSIGVSATASSGTGQAFYGRTSGTAASAEFINDNSGMPALKVGALNFATGTGSNGQVLITNGSNQMSWANSPAPAAPLSLSLTSGSAAPLFVNQQGSAAAISVTGQGNSNDTAVIRAVNTNSSGGPTAGYFKSTANPTGGTGIYAEGTGTGLLANSSAGTAVIASGVTGAAITGSSMGLTVSSAVVGIYAQGGGAGIIAESASGSGGRFWGTGPGSIGAFGRGDQLTATGVWAENPFGGNALVVSGSAQIGYPGGGATTTFVPGNTVIFTGNTVIGLPGPSAPLGLTLNSNAAAPLFVRQNGYAFSISSTSIGDGIFSESGSGRAYYGHSNFSTPAAEFFNEGEGAGVKGSNTYGLATQPGVHGTTASSLSVAAGVRGEHFGVGSGSGVYGATSALGGSGIQGRQLGFGNSGDAVLGINNDASNSGSGVHGQNGSATGAGVLATNSGGGVALRVGGSAIIDSQTNTIVMSSYVSFTAGTNLGGGGVSAPLSLTLNSSANSPLFVNQQSNSGSAAISVTSQGLAVFAESASTTATIRAINNATGLPGPGVPFGMGVYAEGPLGVYARSSQNNGIGLFASVPSGGTSGVALLADDNGSGLGILATGYWVGVSATTSSASGKAFYGRINSTNPAADFVNDGAAAGVRGTNNMATTSSPGVLGLSTSPLDTASGVRGENQSGAGQVYGVYGITNGLSGAGVFGEHTATSGGGSGVFGTTTAPNGSGVQGRQLAASSGGAGVYGSNMGVANFGSGVHGHNPASTGVGVLATNSGGGPALRVGGSAIIDSQTNTIVMASYVSFTAGTNLGGGGGAYLPLSGGTMTGYVDMFPPVLGTHPTTKGYVDGYFLALSGGVMTGYVDMFSPVLGAHPTTKSYVDGNFLALSGGVMTGYVDMFSPVLGAHPTTKSYVDGNFLALSGGVMTGYVDMFSPVLGAHPTTKTYVDGNFLALSGGVMTGYVDMFSPVLGAHPATKSYVDSNFVALSGGTMTGTLNIGTAGRGLSVTASGVSGVAGIFQAVTGVVAVGKALGLSVTGGAIIDRIRYPSSDGSNGQFLATSGTGQLYWETASGVSGAGGPNQIAYWTGGSNLTSESEFYWNSATNNLGLGLSAPQSSLHIQSATSQIWADSFSGSAGSFIGRGAQGTSGSPTNSMAGDVLVILAARGYGDTAYSASNRANIRMRASENWTNFAQGTDMRFATTLNGTTGLADRMTILDSGRIGISNLNPSSLLDLSGDLNLRGMTNAGAPAVSTAGEGRIYFNSTVGKFKVSENGTGYVDMLGGGVSVPLNLTNTTTLASTIFGENTFGGAGIWGKSAGAGTCGTCGENSNPAGAGLSGLNSFTGAGGGVGVFAQANADNGTAVLASATAGSGVGVAAYGAAMGVSSTASSSTGRAFYGMVSSTSATAEFVNFGLGTPLKLNSMKFPPSDGAAGTVLTTDSFGNLYWSSSSGVTPPVSWTASASYPAGVLSTTNTGSGHGVVGYATQPGEALTGDPNFAHPFTAGLHGYTSASSSAGVLGRYAGPNPYGAGVIGLGLTGAGVVGKSYAIGIEGGSFSSLSGTAVKGKTNGVGNLGGSFDALSGTGVEATGLTGVVAVGEGPNATVALIAKFNNGSPPTGVAILAEGFAAGVSATAWNANAPAVYGRGGLAFEADGASRWRARFSVPAPVTGTADIYFDQGTNKLRVSENGGTYQDLVGGGGSVPNPLSLTNSVAGPVAYFKSNGFGAGMSAAGVLQAITATAYDVLGFGNVTGAIISANSAGIYDAIGVSATASANAPGQSIGVLGTATGGTRRYGVYGRAVGIGTGVVAEGVDIGLSATASSTGALIQAGDGAPIYVVGLSATARTGLFGGGTGIYGSFAHPSGSGVGIKGLVDDQGTQSQNNIAILGLYGNAQAPSSFTKGIGVAGANDAQGGIGIYGSTAGSINNNASAAYFKAASQFAGGTLYGVQVNADQSNSVAPATVVGLSITARAANNTNNNASGIVTEATADNVAGIAYGLKSYAVGPTGGGTGTAVGVYGSASLTVGSAYGGIFTATSGTGSSYGLTALGYGYGVSGTASDPVSGVGGYFQGRQAIRYDSTGQVTGGQVIGQLGNAFNNAATNATAIGLSVTGRINAGGGTSSKAYGVYAVGDATNGNDGYGVYAIANGGGSGTSVGVYGQGTVYGIKGGPAGQASVMGLNAAFAPSFANGVGVAGISSANNGVGVYASATAGTGGIGLVATGESIGISVTATNATAAWGIIAQTNAANGAVLGINSNTAVSTYGIKGQGAGSGTGVVATVTGPAVNSKALDANINTPTGFAAYITNPGTLGASFTQGAALYVSGTIKTSSGVYSDPVLYNNTWNVNALTALTFGPGGRIRSVTNAKNTITRIDVYHPQVTTESNVIITFAGVFTPLAWMVRAGNGFFNIFIAGPGMTFDTSNGQGFNFLIIN